MIIIERRGHPFPSIPFLYIFVFLISSFFGLFYQQERNEIRKEERDGKERIIDDGK